MPVITRTGMTTNCIMARKVGSLPQGEYTKVPMAAPPIMCITRNTTRNCRFDISFPFNSELSATIGILSCSVDVQSISYVIWRVDSSSGVNNLEFSDLEYKRLMEVFMTVQLQNVSDQSQIIRDLAGEIETIREKRRAAYTSSLHPFLKRFTQEELADSCYPSYKNLLYGYTQRLPSRVQVLQIADYLECSLQERNDLLLVAQYAPDEIELRDDQYQVALDHAQMMLSTLPFPAYIILKGWMMGSANSHFLVMTGLTHVEQIPRAQRTPVHTVFDKTLPMRHVLERNMDVFKANASLGISLFRTYNQQYQREKWFQNNLHQYQMLADFSEYWQKGLSGAESIPETYKIMDATTGRAVDLRPIFTPLTFASYPVIHVLVPVSNSESLIRSCLQKD